MNARTAELDDLRWHAVLHRHQDRSFVYGVSTTGIYCLAECPSRRPKRTNVVFYESAAEAERAGLRACLRCRPDSADSTAPLLQRMCRALAALETPSSVERTLRELGVEPRRARRIFRSALGMSPSEYARAARGNRLRRELSRGPSNVTQAMLAAGYGSAASFYEEAPDHLGMKPAQYRRGAPGQTIRFALGESSIGSFSVAATERGVCAVALGDDPERLLMELQQRFHAATLIGADADFERVVGTVAGYLDDRPPSATLPLDIRGTAFQQRVWKALQGIQRSETATYQEIARVIGAPQGARAVANACGQNPLAVIIPCHRVVRTDGHIGGYRWGLERKQALLDRERPAR